MDGTPDAGRGGPALPGEAVVHGSVHTPRSAVHPGPDLAGGTRQDARVVPAPEVLDGVVEQARGRTGVAVLPGRSSRRWPWAVAAAVAGAAAGAGVALLVQRLVGEDAPGAQDPEQLVAVVDAEAITPRTDL